jgi:putative phage-type endonuclease
MRTPETLPAPGGLPTARVVLPADAPEDDWHSVRRSGIGGSDVAAILGMHRWKGPLHVWEEKHGRGDHSDSEAAYCGRKFEGVIAEMFSERTGLEIAPSPGTLQHLDRPWMLANIDRLVLERTPAPDPTVVPLEVKNRSEYQARQWEDDVPDEPALQAHWYTAVTGASHAYVTALIGGNRLRWFRLERDEELIAHLSTYCRDWWLQHVVEGTPPPPDGSKATTELLAHLFDVREGATTEVDPVEHMILRERRRELKARIEADGEELAEVENQLRAALGATEVATIGGRPVYTWRQNGNFAVARFRDAEPELAAQYVRMVPAVDTERLAADHPEIYRSYRARRLIVPSEGTS